MEIKGIPNYEIFFDEGVIKVWSQARRKWIKKKDEGTAPGFTLNIEGKRKHFSPGFLRFLMLHPELDARQVSPIENRVKFADDGTVMDLYGNERKSKYSCFKDVDDALATVVAMKAAESGDMAFIHRFIAESRENAIWTVAGLLKTTGANVRRCVEDGEELFISQIKTARCEKIVPLYSWFCRCIKSVMLSKKKQISIEGRELSTKRIPSVTQ